MRAVKAKHQFDYCNIHAQVPSFTVRRSRPGPLVYEVGPPRPNMEHAAQLRAQDANAFAVKMFSAFDELRFTRDWWIKRQLPEFLPNHELKAEEFEIEQEGQVDICTEAERLGRAVSAALATELDAARVAGQSAERIGMLGAQHQQAKAAAAYAAEMAKVVRQGRLMSPAELKRVTVVPKIGTALQSDALRCVDAYRANPPPPPPPSAPAKPAGVTGKRGRSQSSPVAATAQAQPTPAPAKPARKVWEPKPFPLLPDLDLGVAHVKFDKTWLAEVRSLALSLGSCFALACGIVLSCSALCSALCI